MQLRRRGTELGYNKCARMLPHSWKLGWLPDQNRERADHGVEAGASRMSRAQEHKAYEEIKN